MTDVRTEVRKNNDRYTFGHDNFNGNQKSPFFTILDAQYMGSIRMTNGYGIVKIIM